MKSGGNAATAIRLTTGLFAVLGLAIFYGVSSNEDDDSAPTAKERSFRECSLMSTPSMTRFDSVALLGLTGRSIDHVLVTA